MMKLISIDETKYVSGAMATIHGGFSMVGGDFTFKDGFYIAVTGTSASVLGYFGAYANEVVNHATGEILFDGTQSSFCIYESSFSVSSTPGGHIYTYTGSCANT